MPQRRFDEAFRAGDVAWYEARKFNQSKGANAPRDCGPLHSTGVELRTAPAKPSVRLEAEARKKE